MTPPMNQHTDSESLAFLGSLFPGGLKDPGLMAELFPDGWECSPLYKSLPELTQSKFRLFS